MTMDKDYNLMVGLRIREIRESMHLSREKFSEKCDISADYIVLGHKEGFDKDVGIEILSSFNDEQLEHIVNILCEIKTILSGR